jgi:hypothetical protein
MPLTSGQKRRQSRKSALCQQRTQVRHRDMSTYSIISLALTLSSGSSPPLAIVLHPVGRDADRSELKRAFCSSLSEL